jgi:hypothetical protein
MPFSSSPPDQLGQHPPALAILTGGLAQLQGQLVIGHAG